MSVIRKIMSIAFCWSSLYGGLLSDITSSFNEIGNMAVQMGEGFVQMGGVVPASQIYSFQFFNGASVPVLTKIGKIQMIMGAPIPNGDGITVILNQGEDSAGHFYGAHLYFTIKVPQANFSEDHCEQGIASDPNIYIYHTYEDATGIHAEAVTSQNGVPVLSSDFMGMIYNGSNSVFPLTFSMTSTAATSLTSSTTVINKITIPLEPGVFHTLASKSNLTMRPSLFEYPGGSLVISAKGLGSSGVSSTVSTVTVVTPLCYHYEVLPNNKLVETGFSVGNYKQPANGKIRDINPVPYTIWNPTAADLNMTDTTTNTLIPFTSSNTHAIWALYTGSAYSTTKKALVNQPLIKIPAGKAVSLYIIRPPIAKKKDMLYIFSVSSPDDISAQQLLTQFFTIPMPRFTPTGMSYTGPTGAYSYTLPAGFNSADLFTFFNSSLPDKVGLFSKDYAQGYLIYQKTFSSYSPNTNAFFCTAQSPLYSPSTVLGSMLQYFDPTKMVAAVQAKLLVQIPQWVDLFVTNRFDLKNQIQQYLLQYGTSDIVNSSGIAPVLTSNGQLALFMIMYGPGGISKLPLLYTSSNDVTPEAPSAWVSPNNVIPF